MSWMNRGARLGVLALGLGWAAGCTDESPTNPEVNVEPSFGLVGSSPPAPAGLVGVGDLQVWPWTSQDLGETTSDPVNLLFKGDVDIVSLRAALLSLDGDRTAFGFPGSAPFDCTWQDAHGGMQAGYTSGAGWVGNAVQLECGEYAPVRFHIRLFDAGDWVAGAVHFDLLIPGTPQHQVLAWELPQQLVTVDFARSGLLAAPPSGVALSAPSGVKDIPKPIYDGIPDALKVALGLPPGPAAGPAVPIPSDGQATILDVGTAAEVSAGTVAYDLTIPFDQVIPRPFCSSGPTDFVLVQGTVDLSVRTTVLRRGRLLTHNTLRGDLQITPIDIGTGLPSGPQFRARIGALDDTGVGPAGTFVNALTSQQALPPGVGKLRVHLLTGPQGGARFARSERCG